MTSEFHTHLIEKYQFITNLFMTCNCCLSCQHFRTERMNLYNTLTTFVHGILQSEDDISPRGNKVRKYCGPFGISTE